MSVYKKKHQQGKNTNKQYGESRLQKFKIIQCQKENWKFKKIEKFKSTLEIIFQKNEIKELGLQNTSS